MFVINLQKINNNLRYLKNNFYNIQINENREKYFSAIINFKQGMSNV